MRLQWKTHWVWPLVFVGVAACGGDELDLASVAESDVASVEESTVVAVSESIGQVLAAAKGGLTVVHDVEMAGSARLVYANVDDFPLTEDATSDSISLLQPLRAAKARRRSLLLESDTWNARKVRAIVNALFPDVDSQELQGAAVYAEWDGSRSAWMLSDTDPTKMARVLDNVQSETPRDGLDVAFSSRPLAQGPVHWLLPFAMAAYDDGLAVVIARNTRFDRVVNRDVVKIYRGNMNGNRACVVAWRGTYDNADWLRDLQSAFGVIPFWDSDPDNRYGRYFHRFRDHEIPWGFNRRLNLQRGHVDGYLDAGNCDDIYVTGHSLGGAMATIHTLYIYDMKPEQFAKYRDAGVFNPARMLGYLMGRYFRNEIITKSGKLHNTFCRWGDPVVPFPPGFGYGGPNGTCDVWADSKFIWGNPKNHEPSLWYEPNPEPSPVPSTAPAGRPYCGDFEGRNWPPPIPSAGSTRIQFPRGFTYGAYRPNPSSPGALFAGPYQWGGARCGGACFNSGTSPICFYSGH